MPHAMHAQTPSLQAVDGRGLTVRQINYHRAVVGAPAQARVERQQYDPAGRPTASWDARRFARLDAEPGTRPNLANVLSLSGIPLAVDSVDAGWQVSLFGEAGQPQDSWDGRNSHWQSEYDEFLRLCAVHEQSAEQPLRTSERFSYANSSEQAAADNLCGRLIRSDDGAGSEQVQACGILGQVLRQTRRFLIDLELPDWPADLPLREALLEPAAGATTQHTYGPTGETLSQTDASGNRQAFAFGISGQLARISLTPLAASEQVLLDEVQYNAFGQVDTQTAGNGVVSRALFDPADGRLRELITTRGNGEPVQQLLYGYDPVGNVISIEDQAQPTRYFTNQRIEPTNLYSHDSLYQLIEATGREVAGATIRPDLPELALLPLDTSQLLNYTQHYHYDEAGNLLELKHEGAQSYTRTMRVAEDSNRALPWREGDAPPDFAAQFDANGNLQTLTPGQAMRWDARNHLLEVNALTRSNGDNDRERYAYDADGMRLRKTASAQAKTMQHTREVRYLPGLEIRTDSATGERLEVITLQAGRSNVRLLHWLEGKPDGIANNQLRYSVDDQLGSSTLELDSDARLISYEGYYPFGGTAWWAARSAVEANYKVIRYSGKERDASGLYYYGLRYYAPWLMRWINPDPANEADGLNPYLMVMNNPLTLIDPDGGNGVVPNNANWIWLGAPLPLGAAQLINDFTYLNPHYSATLWVDKTTWRGGHGAALENLNKRVRVRRVEEAFEGNNPRLLAAFERERSGPLKSYPAASDIGRIAILEKKGGHYQDVDVGLLKGLEQSTSAPSGVLLHAREEGGSFILANAIIAAPAHSGIVSKAKEKVIENYAPHSENAWKIKRTYDGQEETIEQRIRLSQYEDELLTSLAIIETAMSATPLEINQTLVEQRDSVNARLSAIADICKSPLLCPSRLRLTMQMTGPFMWNEILGNNLAASRFPPDQFQPLNAAGISSYRKPEVLRRASF